MRITPPFFLRSLAAIYFIAFASLLPQAEGLWGSGGILPVTEFLGAARAAVPGLDRFFQFPTIFWLGASGTALLTVCAAGMVFSILLFLGIVPTASLFANWLLYLSIVTAGGDFMSFQWDILLLEAGFLAAFVSWKRQEPPREILWLLWWLVFRLMFFSGYSKLASGDPTWQNLDALRFHYMTQPLPPWTAWYAQQLPEWFQKISCGAMFAIELGAPFLIFMGRRPRRAAGVALIALQIFILVSGNYGIFNWLSIALCLALFMEPGHNQKPAWNLAPLIVLVALLSLFRLPLDWRAAPDILRQARRAVLSAAQPFHLVNSYGLFAVMTRERPEIIMEGSDDGNQWRAYEFRFKPGDVNRRPGFVAPYHPRLDWQMWFAALGAPDENFWFLRFSQRLLEASPPVLKLLKTDPFSGRQPRMIRARLYDYRFSDPGSKRRGAWWIREEKGGYLPPVSIS